MSGCTASSPDQEESPVLVSCLHGEREGRQRQLRCLVDFYSAKVVGEDESRDGAGV